MTHRPWRVAASSAVVVVVGLAMLAGLPSSSERVERYRQAPVCDGPPTLPPSCIEEVDGVVERPRRSGRGRGPADRYIDYRLTEASAHAPPTGTVEVDGSSPLWERLRPGLPVRFGVWGRQVSRITVEGVGTVDTVEGPADAPVKRAVLAVVTIPNGLFGLWWAVRLRRRGGSWRHPVVQQTAEGVRPRVVAAFAWVGFCAGLLVMVSGGEYDIGAAFAGGVVVAVPVGALGFLLYLWKRRRD